MPLTPPRPDRKQNTALPWNVRDHTSATGGRHIWVEGGPPIGETRAGPYKRQILEDEDYEEKAADAALIVKAVNNHEALVGKLGKVVGWLERLAADAERRARNCSYESLREAYIADGKNYRKTVADILPVLEAAGITRPVGQTRGSP